MNNHETEIRRLSARYEAGTATDAEERLLRQLLTAADAAALPPDLRLLRRMFDGLAALAAETVGEAEPIGAPVPIRSLRSDASVSDRLLRTVRSDTANRPLRRETPLLRRLAGWGAAAAVAAVVLLTLGYRCIPYGYIDGRAIYDRDEALEGTACLAQLAALDRSMNLLDNLLPLTEPQPETR